jgi:hypothetical protein
VHRLFDAGYITVTPEYRVEASSRMREDFDLNRILPGASAAGLTRSAVRDTFVPFSNTVAAPRAWAGSRSGDR